MRQAGRYMKEYREVRSRVSFLELCKRPELAAEVTVTAAKTIGADAAIIFADILLITEPMGFRLEFWKDEGPVIHNPFRTQKDLATLRDPLPRETLPFVLEAIRLTRRDLPADVPLIGFAGAPFTVASYVIEGGSSKNFERTKELMRSDPGLWNALLERIASATADYLTAQIEAGAQAVQLFDSWIGCLAPHEYRVHVQPHVRRLFRALPKGVPAIHFGTGTWPFLADFAAAGGNVIGVDFKTPLREARAELRGKAVQGNLDPTVLLSEWAVIRREVDRVLREAGREPGFIFNLGHGILPSTPVENVIRLIRYVHERTAR
jgi:uroporphyrinogen decarboxylase